MATFTGYSIPAIFHDVGADRAVWLADPVPLNEGDGWSASTPLVGARTSTQPVTENPTVRTGHGAFDLGFGALFYNRIQVTPSLIDLGNLLTVQARNVELWNGYLTAKPLESLAWANAEGVSIDTPVALPYALGPLEAVIYTVTSVTQGPSTIDALFTFQVDGEDYELRVIGNRVVVFPFLPDWQDDVTEELAWKTSVERAYAGDEQRRQLRNAGRKKLSYSITLQNAFDASRAENMLFGWQSRNFAVPIPTERSRLSVGATIGTNVLTLDTTDKGFYSGQPAILYGNSREYEAVEIETAASGSLTLARPLGQTWGAGTRVFPVGVAHLPNQQQLTRESDFYITATLDWAFEVTDANAHTPTAAAPVSYLGQEVHLVKPDWSSKPSFTYDDAFITFGEDDIGPLEFDQTSDFPMVIRQHRYVQKTRAAITTLRQFLGRRKGRLAPCWIPSWNSDFFITEDVDSSASVITVRDNGYRAFVAAHAARRDIAIFLRGVATPILLRINDTVDNFDGTINLVLDTTVGSSFNADDVRQICHMNLFRLGSDAVTLQWLTEKVTTVTLNWVLVKG